jgi:hypothetical protein
MSSFDEGNEIAYRKYMMTTKITEMTTKNLTFLATKAFLF